MKKSKNKKRICIFLVVVLIVSGIAVFISIVVNFALYRERGTFVWYNQNLISANERYIGFIDEANDKVRIITHSGKEISCVDISDREEDNPDGIFLGEQSYFLQYSRDNPRIVQYDYCSDKIRKYVAPGAATIACRGGYLFLGERGKQGEHWFSSFYDSFCADGYVKESELESQPRPLTEDKSGRCRVGGVELYQHKEGFYCTEPDIGDYPGMSWEEFWTDERENRYRAHTEREGKNHALVAGVVDKDRGGSDTFCEISEYQKGRFIYGICNSYSVNITSAIPTKQENVIKSYAYRIDPAKEIIKILGQVEKCIGIVASETVFVYQKGNKIYQENIVTGDMKVIYNIKNTNRLNLYVNGDYLLVVEWDRKLFSRKQSCYPVRWKDTE